MANGPIGELIGHLRRRAGRQITGGLPDAELLQRFVERRDDVAFEVLLLRHAPMVFAVCRRLLRHSQDAEDAFQATFLAFVRHADSIGRGEAVGAWLYQVAFRAAVKAKAGEARQQRNDKCRPQKDFAGPNEDVDRHDFRQMLDQEVNRLPKRYQRAVTLFYFDGKSCSEAAAELGCPPGTVVTWLARSRDLLRRRLSRGGLALSAAAIAASLKAGAAPAAVPAVLLQATVRAGRQVLAGTPALGAASAQAMTLCAEVLRAMSVSKVNAMTASVLAVGLLVGGTGLLARQAIVGDTSGAKPPAPAGTVQKNQPQDWVGYDTRETDLGPELRVTLADGTSKSYKPTADAAIIAYLANRAYGSVAVPLNVNLADTNRALLRFDVPETKDVRKAELILRRAKDLRMLPPEPFDIAIHEVTAPWDEATVTWANQPAFADRPAVTICVDSRRPELLADVTPLVRRSPDKSGASRLGWLLKVAHPLRSPEPAAVSSPTNPKWVGFSSREAGNGPELVLQADDGSSKTYPAAADAVVLSYLPHQLLGRTPAWLSVDLDDTNRVLVRFDVPAGKIRNAELVLHAAKPEPGKTPIPLPDRPFDVSVHEITAAWDEGTVTWSNMPAFAEKPILTASIDPKAAVVRIDVSKMVRRLAAADAPKHGWLLRVEPASKPLPSGPAGNP
jgi:RNA polymerase sigma factor (sigma-70 family)